MIVTFLTGCYLAFVGLALVMMSNPNDPVPYMVPYSVAGGVIAIGCASVAGWLVTRTQAVIALFLSSSATWQPRHSVCWFVS
jgi:hypothetical protein